MRIQGLPGSPHQRGTRTHLNPVGRYLQEDPTRGRTNTNNGTAGKYRGQSSGRRGYCRGSAETPVGTGGSTIGHERRTLEYMNTGVNQVDRPRHREVGKFVECNAGSVTGGIHPGGIDMDNDVTYTEVCRRV